MTKRKRTRKENFYRGGWAILIIPFFILFTSRIYFGDLYNAFYQPTLWKWWVWGYGILNLIFLVMTIAVVYFSIKGWSKREHKGGWREKMAIGLGEVVLVIFAYSFCVLLGRTFEALTKPQISYKGNCGVRYVRHRKASDDYYMNLANYSIRITYGEYRQVYPVGYATGFTYSKCIKRVDVKYLQGLNWPVEFKAEL